MSGHAPCPLIASFLSRGASRPRISTSLYILPLAKSISASEPVFDVAIHLLLRVNHPHLESHVSQPLVLALLSGARPLARRLCFDEDDAGPAPTEPRVGCDEHLAIRRVPPTGRDALVALAASFLYLLLQVALDDELAHQ